MSVAHHHLPRRLFDAIYEMNAANTHADFISAVVTGLARLIRSDVCGIHVLDRQRQRLIEKMFPGNPYTDEEVNRYKAHPEDNPLVAYFQRTGDTHARRVSDVMDRKAWLQGNHYRYCLSRLGLRHFLALPVTVDAHTVAGLSFNRIKPDFTLRDCALLDAFAPHFRLAWSRHPDPWIKQLEAPVCPAPLTAREEDVLYWITEGKQNREIAMILGISLYTVQKHVANILRKLDVENRHALTVLTLNRAAGR